jgi:predicted DNA-binding protein (MmcQ/YjbR family)
MDPLATVREICLAYPEATEQLFGGHAQPTFRVRGRIFAMYVDDHHEDRRLAIWCKAGPGGQDVLVSADPGRYFAPPYVGPKGWVGMRLEGAVDWDDVRALIDESYRLIAPKRLVAELDGRPR